MKKIKNKDSWLNQDMKAASFPAAVLPAGSFQEDFSLFLQISLLRPKEACSLLLVQDTCRESQLSLLQLLNLAVERMFLQTSRL